MPPKKKTQKEIKPSKRMADAYISGAGTVMEQPITRTLETNFMPYAMSAILSRAIPEIDGFKPSHRKLLYTMYLMGLLNGAKTKSANIVGQTMRLNPHGDAAIYETMVRLTEGNEALLHPFVDSKGNMGKAYSRDMAYAAPRYTEAKLAPIAGELFKDIDRETVDFVDNYDATMKEPTLFPVTFPTILVNANKGIAVGMTNTICPFNLREVCRAEIEYIKDEDINIADYLTAPDFPGGGELLYDRAEMEKIYSSGVGSFKVRSVYSYDKKQNCIDITEIPPTTTIEAIIEKIVDLVKQKKITGINDIRDETDLSGLKITIDLKRATDPEKLMQKLFKTTPLQDSFSCNFNILVGGTPRVMGIKDILCEWTAFRVDCVKRRTYYNLIKAKDKYHLLKGLQKILLDIDKAVKIVRETAEEKEVVPNLMIGFGIDEIQAEYVAEIKLRHLNREYIIKRLEDVERLESEIAELESVLDSRRKQLRIIIKELEEVAEKYGQDRRTKIISAEENYITVEEEPVPDYPVTLFFTKDGYFKKITAQSLRLSSEQKLKDGDEITRTVEANNSNELLVFTNLQQVYKCRVSDFADCKASVLGEYMPAKLDFNEGEFPVFTAVTDNYTGYIIFVFENGRVSKVPLSAYATKTNRKKLINAYSAKFRLSAALQLEADCDILLTSTNGRMLLLNTGALQSKVTKDNTGVAVMTQKKGQRIFSAAIYSEGMLSDPHRYRTRTLPAAGNINRDGMTGEQMKI